MPATVPTLLRLVPAMFFLLLSVKIIRTDCIERRIPNRFLKQFLMFGALYILFDVTLRVLYGIESPQGALGKLFSDTLFALVTAIVFGVVTFSIAVLPGRPLGMGDVKLFMVTVFFGFHHYQSLQMWTLYFVALFVTTLVSLVVAASKKSLRARGIPYAPAILIAFWVAILDPVFTGITMAS